MRKVLKKSLALILALTMVFGAAPLAGLVGLELPSLKDVFAEKAEAATYGVLTYEINDAEVTITDCNTSASGDLIIPSSIEGYPVTSIGCEAFNEQYKITSVEIPNSVTSIGERAFYDCDRLKEIRIPDSVTSIGVAAFGNCTKLESISVDINNQYYSSDEFGVLFNKYKTGLIQYPEGNVRTEYIIPNSVSSIGSGAFYLCSSLTIITIPDSVTSISDYAFSGCTGLTSITIPDSVTSISRGAFTHCTGLRSVTIPDSVTSISIAPFENCTNLESISVDKNNEYYSSDEFGVLFSKDKTKLIQYPIGNTKTEYTILDSVKSIEDYSFYFCTNLKSVTIGNGTSLIGSGAFAYCSNLTDVTIPEGVTSIGMGAFLSCVSLSNVAIPDSVTFIDELAFSFCYSIKSITIPGSIKEIGKEAFENCTSLKNATICNGVISIGELAFLGCSSLTSITLPFGINSIGSNAFSQCESLKDITIPNSVTTIGHYAFHYCYGLTDIIIPSSVTNIGVGAFEGCSNLKNVEISNSVSIIDSYTFKNCTNLSSITIGNSVTSIGGGAFYGCTGLTSVTIPDSVTSIGEYAFKNCTGLKSATIPYNVTSIGDGAFDRCTSLTSITVDYANTTYSSDEHGVLFNKGKAELIKYPIGNERTEYTIPDSVTCIGEDAFYGCEGLTSITIPNGVTSISNYAFGYCTGLTSITISNSVTSISGGAFTHCTGLKSIEIPDSVTSIGGYAFYNCTSLTDVYYAGTEDEWNAIRIDSNNSYLTNANIHYNSNSGGENPDLPGTGDKDPETPAEEMNIAVLTTERSLCVKIGESMSLSFGLMKNGLLDGEWKKMSVVVSDPSIVSLSDYRKTYFGYAIDVKGEKKGSTNFVVTDTESGKSISFIVNVYDSFVSSSSFDINNIRTFYPNNKWESKIQTNIYNMNGLYINNYNCSKEGKKYKVSFDVYNSKFHNGAVDIFDENGTWIGSEIIDKYSDISSLWDTGEQAFYLITNTIALIPGGKDSNFLTYEQESFSKHTHIEIEVPDGGYFTISNNFAESMGTFLYNACEILYEGVSTLIDLATADSIDVSAFSKLIANDIADDPISRKMFQEIFIKTVDNEIRSYSKNILSGNVSSAYAGISELLENILDSLNIEWKHLFKSVTGVGESIFVKLSGPAGLALKGCFAISKGTNKFSQAIDLAKSIDETYANIYSKINEGTINSYGVIINTNGNIDSEAVLQVFRISDSNIADTIINSDNPLEKYELYNICFVKNDTLIQPKGKVKVYIPIPDGMNSDTCNVYRQEDDGNWTVLDAHVEGNYLVFETDHFSFYAVIGDMAKAEIKTLPKKLDYYIGETLDSSGLTLNVNEETIDSGFICTPTVIFKEGKQMITVKYGSSTVTFNVNVSQKTDEYDNQVLIRTPSTASIDYGDSIILHADIDGTLPAGARIEWTADNSNFSMSVSADGTTCKISPKSNGKTVFTATVYDKDGNVISSDTQEMTAKAGLWQKIVAFFKKIFGLTKTFPEAFKGIL